MERGGENISGTECLGSSHGGNGQEVPELSYPQGEPGEVRLEK